MKKGLWIWVIIGVVVIGGIVWWQIKSEVGRKEVLNVGAILPLTGKAARYGEEMRRGIDLALEDSKGVQVRVFYEDSKFDTKEGVSAYYKLRNVNHISAVITAVSPIALAISPLANRDKVLQMAIAASTPKYTSPEDFTFRVTPRAEVEDRELVRFVVPRYKRIGLLYINNEWGLGHRNSIIPEIRSLGGMVVGEETFSPQEVDFRAQLTKLKEKSPEAIFLLARAKTAGIVLKQARELGIKAQFFGIRSLQSKDLISIAGEAAEGVIYTYPFNPQSSSPRVRTFVERYKAKYNEIPTSYVAEGYDALKLIVKAFKDCGKVDTECMKEDLLRTKNYPGILGNLTFDRNGDVYFPYFIKTVKNGEFVEYKGK